MGAVRIPFLAALCLVAVGAAGPVRANDYPSGNVTTVVALGAGSAMDVITRLYNQALSTRFGKPFIVENRGAAAVRLAGMSWTRSTDVSGAPTMGQFEPS